VRIRGCTLGRNSILSRALLRLEDSIAFFPSRPQGCVQAISDGCWKLHGSLVPVELDGPLGSIQHDAAAVAVLQMRFQLLTEISFKFSVNVEIQFLQDSLAVHKFRFKYHSVFSIKPLGVLVMVFSRVDGCPLLLKILAQIFT